MMSCSDNWRTDAACLGAPTALFFPGDPPPAARIDQARRQYCNRCPVLDRCHADAAANPNTEGIWAGQYWRHGTPCGDRTSRPTNRPTEQRNPELAAYVLRLHRWGLSDRAIHRTTRLDARTIRLIINGRPQAPSEPAP